MRRAFDSLSSARRRVLLFGLIVFLPSLVLGVLAFQAFRTEEERHQLQQTERRNQIVRLLEADLRNWILSLRGEPDAPHPLVRFVLSQSEIRVPKLSVTIDPSIRPTGKLSAEASRIWRNAEMRSMSATDERSRRAAFEPLLDDQRLGSLARLALLRLSLNQKNAAETERWLKEIREKDDEAGTESGIPIPVAAAFLLIQSGSGASKQNASAITSWVSGLTKDLQRGRWNLSGAQWILYAKELSAAFPGDAGDTTIAENTRHIEFLTNHHSQLMGRARSFRPAGDGLVDLDVVHYPASGNHVALLVEGEPTAGYVIPTRHLRELAEKRLASLIVAGEFQASISTDVSGGSAGVDGYLAPLSPWTPMSVVLSNPADSAFPAGSLYLYGILVLVLIAVSGTVFVYRAVSHEVEITRMKADFVAAVSHEFRSPLASVSALMERLESGRVSDEPTREKYYRAIRQETHRLCKLVDGLLDFAGLEEGRKEFHYTRIDLAQLARETIASLRNLGHGDRVTWQEPEDSRPLSAVADRTAIERCLHNLIDNALKYSPENSPVTVRAGGNGAQVYLEVVDQGFGIEKEEQQKIFEQFYRSKNSDRHNVQGAGLGLALVRRIMESQRGSVIVESDPGRGSHFRLVLPATSTEG